MFTCRLSNDGVKFCDKPAPYRIWLVCIHEHMHNWEICEDCLPMVHEVIKREAINCQECSEAGVGTDLDGEQTDFSHHCVIRFLEMEKLDAVRVG